MNQELQHIIDELKEISPFLLSIRKKEGFIVPDQYFITSNVDLKDRVEDDEILPHYLKNKIREGFTVPAPYFKELPTSIQDHLEDEQILPTFLQTKQTEGYEVPVNYFEELPEEIIVKLEIERALEEEEKTEGFGVPNGYFNQLSDSIIDHIKQEEEEEKEFKEIIDQKEEETKVLPLWRRFRTLGSVAAIGLLLLFGIQFFNKSEEGNQIDLSKDQAFAYLMDAELDVENDIFDGFSSEEISEILNTETEEKEININVDDINLDDLDLEEIDF